VTAPDGVGIQQHLIDTWGGIAEALAGDPAIAGYDLLNEPNPGYFVVDAAALGQFYRGAIDAIRDGEAAAGGDSRMIFFEPSALWSALSFHPTPDPGFSADPNLVFAPHVYAESLTADQSMPAGTVVSIEAGHEHAASWAAAHGTTYWSGEWGWFGDPATQGARATEYARVEDARLVGGAWWSWKQACGDPHQIGTPGNPPSPVSPSLVRFACPGDVEIGIPPEFGTVLSRSYPRAAPGRLTSLTSEPATGAAQLTGEAPGAAGEAAVLDLWVPDRRLGEPVVTGTNVSDRIVHPVAGGWRVTATATGSYRVDVRPASAVDALPRAGSGLASSAPGPGTATLPATGGASPVVWALLALLAALILRRTGRLPSRVGGSGPSSGR
jgi:endoglycosylceramidase